MQCLSAIPDPAAPLAPEATPTAPPAVIPSDPAAAPPAPAEGKSDVQRLVISENEWICLALRLHVP